MTVDEWGVRVRGGMRLTMVEVGQMLADLAEMTADRDDLLAYFNHKECRHLLERMELLILIAHIEARRKEQGK